MVKKVWFILLLVLASFAAQASVVVQGKAEGISNTSIHFFCIDDYLTGHRTLLGSQAIVNDGSFTFEWNTPFTRELVVSVGIYESSFYVEPNATYRISIALPKTKEIRKFDRNPLLLVVEQEPTSALNAAIEAYDADYTKFISDHFYDFATTEYRGSEVFKTTQAEKSPEVDMFRRRTAKPDSVRIEIDPAAFGTWVMKFEAAVHAKYGKELSQPFFKEYTRYHQAQLEMWSGIGTKTLYTKYLHQQTVQHYNPAYISFFELYYHDIFTNLRKQKSEEVMNIIQTERKFGKLETSFAQDSTMLFAPVRELAMIKGLREAYFNKAFSRNAVLATLKDATLNLADSSLRKTAFDLDYTLRVAKAGWEVEDFTLLDENDRKWRLDEQRGKYIYFIFFSAESTSSAKELALLENAQSKYGKSVDIIAVCMDQDYSKFKAYLANHRNQKFTFLSGKGDALLGQKLNIRSVPYAVMLDPNHKVMSDYTKRPSEGITTVWDKLQEQSKKGGKTWKE